MNILITLCARGGSKGIPGKNIKQLNGIPLIAYSIKAAQEFCKLHAATIVLSTDSDLIKEIASNYGLNTEFKRTKNLANDEVGKIDVIKDVLNYTEMSLDCHFDYILDLDITSPLRTIEDLDVAFELINSNPEAVNLFSVSKAKRNPYFNMVEKKGNGFYSLIKNKTDQFLTRQSSPCVYDMNASFYFYKRKFFEQNYKSAITDKSLIFEMQHECFDLDEPIDFEIMSYLLANNKLDFQI